MKKNVLKFFTLVTALFLMSCGSEKKKEDVIIAMPEKKVEQKETQKMSDYTLPTDVQWIGKKYQVIVTRTADSKLGLVKVDENTKFYDNRVNVRVLRADGSEFFNRTFTKKDFRSYITDRINENGALTGITYVDAKGDNLIFACSVGSPSKTSDEYIPLIMKISRMGAVSISKDGNLDTSNDSGDDMGEEASEG